MAKEMIWFVTCFVLFVFRGMVVCIYLKKENIKPQTVRGVSLVVVFSKQ